MNARRSRWPLGLIIIGLASAGCFGRSLGTVTAQGTRTAIDQACVTFTAVDGKPFTIESAGLSLPLGWSVAFGPPRIVRSDGASFGVGDRVVVAGQAFEPEGDFVCSPPYLRLARLDPAT